MSKEDVQEYIKAQMEEPVTIKGDDLEPPKCARCGEELNLSDPDIAIWKLKHRGLVAATLYYYCSTDHHHDDIMDEAMGNDRPLHHEGYEVSLGEAEDESA